MKHKNLIKQKDNNKNKSANKKNDLIEKMKNQPSSKKKMTITTPELSDDTDYKELYRKTKNELNKLQKSANKSKQSKDDKSNDEEFKKAKKDLFEIKKEFADIQKENNELKQDLAQMQDEHNQEIQILTKEHSELLDKISRLEESTRKFNITKENFKKLNEKHTKVLNQANEIKSNFEKTKNQLAEERKISHKLRLENQKILSISPYILLQHLIDNLSIRTFKEYGLIDELHNRVHLLRKIDRRNNQKNVPRTDDFKELFGYIRLINDETIFVDTKGINYKISSFPNYEGDFKDAPVQAVQNSDDTVDIIYFHKVNSREYKLSKEKASVRVENQKDDEKDYHFIGDFKIVVVTEKDKEKYKSRLEKHGLDVTVYDGFGKYAQLSEKIKSADIVVYLVDNLSHVATNLAKAHEQSDKFQYISNPNPEKVVQRIVFAKHQLNL